MITGLGGTSIVGSCGDRPTDKNWSRTNGFCLPAER